MRIFAFLDDNTNGLAFFIQLKTYFLRRKINGPLVKSFFTKNLRQVIEQQNSFKMCAFFCFNNCLHVFIGKPMVAVYDCSANPFMFYFAAVGYLKNYGESVFIFIGTQRT